MTNSIQSLLKRLKKGIDNVQSRNVISPVASAPKVAPTKFVDNRNFFQRGVDNVYSGRIGKKLEGFSKGVERGSLVTGFSDQNLRNTKNKYAFGAKVGANALASMADPAISFPATFARDMVNTRRAFNTGLGKAEFKNPVARLAFPVAKSMTGNKADYSGFVRDIGNTVNVALPFNAASKLPKLAKATVGLGSIGFGANKLSGSSNRESFMEAGNLASRAPAMVGFNNLTAPGIAKVAPKLSLTGKTILESGRNVLEGAAINSGTDRGMFEDAAVDAIFGAGGELGSAAFKRISKSLKSSINKGDIPAIDKAVKSAKNQGLKVDTKAVNETKKYIRDNKGRFTKENIKDAFQNVGMREVPVYSNGQTKKIKLPVARWQTEQAAGLAGGIEPQYDDEGNRTGFGYDPMKGAAGLVAGSLASKLNKRANSPERKALEEILQKVDRTKLTGRQLGLLNKNLNTDQARAFVKTEPTLGKMTPRKFTENEVVKKVDEYRSFAKETFDEYKASVPDSLKSDLKSAIEVLSGFIR